MEGSKGSVRLFGKVIHVDVGEDCARHHAVEEDQKMKSLIKDGDQESTGSEGISRSTVITENYKPLAQNKRDPPARVKSSDQEEEESDDASNSQENGLQKPDKVLPCARCDSRDTKFCYYNNYNVNQPRYFCRNCQRYWTAGGSMRDVPIGAGRRKNKSYASSRYRQVAIPTAQNVEQMNGSNVLCFGSEVPLNVAMLNNHGYASEMPLITKSSSTGRQWMSPGVNESRYTLNSQWSCVVPSGAWNMPWLSPTVSLFDSPLGKRSRGGNAVNHCSLD